MTKIGTTKGWGLYYKKTSMTAGMFYPTRKQAREEARRVEGAIVIRAFLSIYKTK